jgi:hypothetical protein
MIKECKVLSYNKYLNILVFDFNGKQIQTTAKLDTECKTVFVKYKDGKYEIVSKSEYERSIRSFNKKKEKEIEINSEENAEIDNSEL